MTHELWNNTQKNYDRQLTIHRLFEMQAEKTPDAIAVVSDCERITFAELNKRSNQLARCIKELLPERHIDLSQGFFVGIFLQRDIDLIISMLAVLKAGGAYVPLDLNYPVERISYILRDTNVKFVLSHSMLQNKITKVLEKQLNLFYIDLQYSYISLQNNINLNLVINSQNLAYVIYTSGSSGTPKGVLIKHQGVVSLIFWGIREFRHALKFVLFSTSICFDLSIFELFVTLAYGGKVYIVKHILDLIASPPKKNITLINTVPSSIAALLAHKAIPHSVRTIILAGEPVSAHIIRALSKNIHIKKIYNLYGPSETTTYSTCYQIKKGHFPAQIIGMPIDNTLVYILDENLQIVPPGVIGQIYIGGDGVAAGYLNKKKLSQEKFVTNFFNKGTGNYLYKTGDLARYQADGNIEYLGRIDNQIKLNGYRIELGEIETCLLKYPSIHHAIAVIAGKVARNRRLIVFIVGEEHLNKENIRRFLQNALPHYMIPALDDIMILDKLPKTTNGKIDRALLSQMTITQTKYKKTNKQNSTLQAKVQTIWAEALQCHVTHIKMHHDFFELGGNSLKALEIITKTNKVFQKNISLYDLFFYPIFSDFLKNLCNKKVDEIKSVTKKSVNAKPVILLTREQVDKYHNEQNSYTAAMNNLLVSFVLRGELNVNIFQRAVNDLIKRHQILSTNIVKEQKNIYLINAGNHSCQFNFINLSLKPYKEKYFTSQVENYQNNPVDLFHQPLFFVSLFQCSKKKFFVVIYIHHIIADLFSLQILESELMYLYQKKYEKNSMRLPAAKQFTEFSVRENFFIGSPDFKRQLAAFKKTILNKNRLFLFSGKSDVIDNAADYFSISCSCQVAEKIKQFAIKKQVSMFVIFLALFKAALFKWSGQQSFATGSIVSARANPDFIEMIGLLVNYVVIYNTFSTNETFSSLLNQVKAEALAAFQYSAIPYSLLRSEINKAEKCPDIYRPLFNIFFDYQEPDIKNNIIIPNVLKKENLNLNNSLKVNRCLSFRVINTPEEIRFLIRYKKALLLKKEVELFMGIFTELCYTAVDSGSMINL